jgi:hypothetical protein
MWLQTLVVLTVITIVVCWQWPRIHNLSADPSRRPATGAQGGDPRAVRPESLEGVLVAKLMAGEINCGQYVRTIEGIAARDDERHPLAVPPDIGPADA